jgi:hypothetical protein
MFPLACGSSCHSDSPDPLLALEALAVGSKLAPLHRWVTGGSLSPPVPSNASTLRFSGRGRNRIALEQIAFHLHRAMCIMANMSR